MKKCITCKFYRPLCCFGIYNRNKDGLRSFCKKCQRLKLKQSYQKNKESAKKFRDKWREENPERYREINAAYYRNNKQYYIDYNRKRYRRINNVPEEKWRKI